jgi:hypothetical protein
VTLAIQHWNLEAVRYILDSELYLNKYGMYEPSRYTKDPRRAPASSSRSSISLALAVLDVDILRLLLDGGVRPRLAKCNGWTPN